MAVITIGSAAIDRATGFAITTTRVGKGGAASDSGSIDTVELWLSGAGTLVEVAAFAHAGSNVLSTRDSEALGNVASGSKQTFSSLDMNVVAGDYLGIYGTVGTMELDTSGDGIWKKTGDYIPCTSETFTSEDNLTISLYGTGETVAVGWTGEFGGATIASGYEICGVSQANIEEITGVA